ncbi:MAG: Rho termination factor N-terminal domain-containing protein [Deltaproteobacteria bacterium]|nr:Rho termination factor N-terminal domain-containing protein [Deltaproteobacteria bacterium]
MAKKEKKEKKEKPLDKMTAKELRELALGIEGIVGVHAMNKSELIAALKKAQGIEDEKKGDKSVDVRSIKKKIRELRSQREAVRETGEKDKLQMLRRRISRLKKKTRRAATKAA